MADPYEVSLPVIIDILFCDNYIRGFRIFGTGRLSPKPSVAGFPQTADTGGETVSTDAIQPVNRRNGCSSWAKNN